MHQFPPRRRGTTSTSQQTTRAKVPRSGKGLEDGCWPKRSSSFPTSHHAYPGTTRHCDMVRQSQVRHHCGADCTLGREHGRSLREEETLVWESTHGMWRQRMGLSSDAHRGWLSWLHRSNNNLIPDHCTTAWLNRSPSFLLPYPHPTPPQPHPSSTLSLPPPPPSLSPRVHTEHPAALAPPSDITRWLNLLVALERGVPPVATETT